MFYGNNLYSWTYWMEFDFSRNWWVQKLQAVIPLKKEWVSHTVMVSTECKDCVSEHPTNCLCAYLSKQYWLLCVYFMSPQLP